MHRLRIGFIDTAPEDEAIAAALADWREACEREGEDPGREPLVRIVRDDPERAALGEYVVEVSHGAES